MILVGMNDRFSSRDVYAYVLLFSSCSSFWSFHFLFFAFGYLYNCILCLRPVMYSIRIQKQYIADKKDTMSD